MKKSTDSSVAILFASAWFSAASRSTPSPVACTVSASTALAAAAEQAGTLIDMQLAALLGACPRGPGGGGGGGGGDPIDPCRSNPGCALNSIAMQTFYHNNTYRDGRASYNDDGAQGLPLPTYPQVKDGGGGGGGGTFVTWTI